LRFEDHARFFQPSAQNIKNVLHRRKLIAGERVRRQRTSAAPCDLPSFSTVQKQNPAVLFLAEVLALTHGQLAGGGVVIARIDCGDGKARELLAIKGVGAPALDAVVHREKGIAAESCDRFVNDAFPTLLARFSRSKSDR